MVRLITSPEMMRRGLLPALSTSTSETEDEVSVCRPLTLKLTSRGQELDHPHYEGAGVGVHAALHSLEHIHGLEVSFMSPRGKRKKIFKD